MRFAVATSVIAAVEAETEAIVWLCYQYDNFSAQSGLAGAADTNSARLRHGDRGLSGWDGLEQSRTAGQTAWGNYSIRVNTLQTPRRAHALLAFAARC